MQNSQMIGYSLNEIEEIIAGFGFKPNLAREICTCIYRRGIFSFDRMINLPIELRRKLNVNFDLYSITPINTQISIDGTEKYLFRTINGNPFETAFMPGDKRNTLCISTQSGCRMGCEFCFTGTLGLKENLSRAQILGQLLYAAQSSKINRIVLMGMGEPLDNPVEVFSALEILNANWGFAFGAANITLSTVGIIPQLHNLVKARQCNVAISMHSPFHEERVRIIPVEKDYPIHSIVDFFKVNPVSKPLRLSFEYVVIPAENDTEIHAAEIAKLLADITCMVNVIPLNSKRDNDFNVQAATQFHRRLNNLGQSATLRLSRGNDIDAACGMMAGKGD